MDSAVQACIDSLPTNSRTSYVGTIKKNSQYRIIVQKYTNIDWASAIMFSYDAAGLKYYRKTSGTWQNPTNFITTDDYVANGTAAENCNNLTDPGIYPKVITATATNGPGYYAYLLNLHYIDANNNNITQVAFGYNTGTISIRNRYNGTWSAWTKK